MNKILVCVYVPLIEQEFDIFIPINRKIGLIKKIIANSIIELTNNSYRINGFIKLSNKKTNHVYNDDEFVVNTDIRNGTKLVLL